MSAGDNKKGPADGQLERALASSGTSVVVLDAALQVLSSSVSADDDTPTFAWLMGPGYVSQGEELCRATLDDHKVRWLFHARDGVHYDTRIAAFVDDDATKLMLTLHQEEKSKSASPMADRRLFQVALSATKLGLWNWHLPSNSVVWNEHMHTLTGQSVPTTMDRFLAECVHPDDRDGIAAHFEAIDGGAFSSPVARLVRPDGEVRWFMTNGFANLDAAGNIESMYGGVVDVTEQQRMADKLKAAQHMEALGHLTAGVAHNFNNMLMIIGPSLHRVREEVEGEFLEDIDDAIAASERSAEIVAQLMSFAGKQHVQARSTQSIARICDETTRLCQHSMPASLEMRVHIDARGQVECAAGALEQVLSNVILNAKDALIDCGRERPRIVVSCKDVDYFDESWVEIVVRDNGPGIPDEVRTTLFEPFVTTKGSNGTGLGLASSQAIVTQHGGQLACRPAPDEGTEFLILLPSVGKAPQLEVGNNVNATKPSPSSSPPTSAKVLVVDDEVAIRRLLQRGLARFGHEVVLADSPAELEKQLPQHPDVDVVLLDRSLGTDKGETLVPAIRQALPDAKVYFFTGEFVDSSSNEAGVDGVFHKPLQLQELADRVTQVMHEKMQ